ncbi:MAG: oxidoreductase, partial [Actinomycetes bacterium]
SWTASEDGVGGYRSGSTWLRRGHGAVAVGPTGSDVSWDGGRSWTVFDTGSLDSVECARSSCWASGEAGRVAVLARRR